MKIDIKEISPEAMLYIVQSVRTCRPNYNTDEMLALHKFMVEATQHMVVLAQEAQKEMQDRNSHKEKETKK